MTSTTSINAGMIVNTTAASTYGYGTFAALGLSLTTAYTAIAHDNYGRYATNTVNVNLARNITFQYDLNGNLTNDGLRSFAYDDENQLIQVWVPGQWSSSFSYDGKMRRRIRQEYTWTGSAWLQTNAVYYVYDGNLVIQERDINNLPTTTYTRGKDLSGSLEGAGGIGGLLARSDYTLSAVASGEGGSFYHCDGNGNITMLINSEQAIVAKYLYDAFGNVLSASGLLANANRYQFSSKEKDLNSGLVYYLYRYYDPNLQRWPNRDPLGEVGGANLFEFVENDPIGNVDLGGEGPLKWWHLHKCLQAVKKWEENCKKNIPNCDDPCLDAFAYAACLEKQRDVVADCVKKAKDMIIECQKATNPADPPVAPIPPPPI